MVLEGDSPERLEQRRKDQSFECQESSGCFGDSKPKEASVDCASWLVKQDLEVDCASLKQAFHRKTMHPSILKVLLLLAAAVVVRLQNESVAADLRLLLDPSIRLYEASQRIQRDENYYFVEQIVLRTVWAWSVKTDQIAAAGVQHPRLLP